MQSRDTSSPSYQLGRRIATRRAALHKSAAGLAEEIGIHPVTLSRLENGHVRNVSAETLLRLAAALEVTERWLLYGDEAAAAVPA